MTRHRAFAALLCAALLPACDESAPREVTGPVAESQIKFFNFGVNAPSVNFYANDTKVTAILSGTGTEATTGVAYGGVGSGGLYSALDPGQYNFTGRISATVDKDLSIATVSTTLQDGMKYSLYLSGFYNPTTKTVDAFVVEDAFAAESDYSKAFVRFVHAMSNANPMGLFATDPTTSAELPVGGTVSYKSAGAFTAIPPGVYNLATRYAGATTSAITRTQVSFSAGRVYTISARGDVTVTSTTATNRPFLDNTTNR